MAKDKNYEVICGGKIEFFCNPEPLKNYIKALGEREFQVFDLAHGRADITYLFKPAPKAEELPEPEPVKPTKKKWSGGQRVNW